MLGAARALARAAATTPAARTASKWYSIQVVVPPLGESITDGTIATVLKKAGDSVQENETIAQIETDKVTVDIKAPSDGTVLGVVVQEQDTVVPGQLVATLDDAAAKANHIGAASPAAAAAAAEAPTPAAAAAPAPAPAPAHAGRRAPGIRFPPRITADGRRVSQLPAAEAVAFIEQWKAGSAAAAPGAGSAAPSAPEAAPAAAKPVSLQPAAAAAAAADGPVQPSKFASSAVRLERMPARRELTDKEMELIELGGAA